MYQVGLDITILVYYIKKHIKMSLIQYVRRPRLSEITMYIKWSNSKFNMMSLSYVFKVVNLKLKISIYIFINIFDLILLNIRCSIKFSYYNPFILKKFVYKICTDDMYHIANI